jgi:hypothetical protein
MTMDEISSDELIKQRDALEVEVDELHRQAEGHRIDAEDLEHEARAKEKRTKDIEAVLRSRGELYNPEHAAAWGVPIARAVFGTDERIHLRMCDADWVSNGSMAWRVDVVPDGCRQPAKPDGVTQLGVEMMLERHLVDMAAPISTGVHPYSKKGYSDFQSAIGVVRFADLYWQAAQAAGDAVSVTKTTSCLVAYREGVPMVVAMPMTRDGDDTSRP